MSALPRHGYRRVRPPSAYEERGPWGLPMRELWSDGAKVRQEGHCRMCLRGWDVRPPTRHHLVPQHWFRTHGHERWRNAGPNIIPLCRPCHDLVEDDRKERRMLRRRLTQREIAFAIAVRGQAWLDRVYPSND